MDKKLWGVISLILLMVLAGCQDRQATPEERLADYIEHWNDGDFAEMYRDYLNEGTKQAYAAEDFVERQEKLHNDLAIENLEVTFTEAPEDTEWDPEQPADFPVQITMDTLAGPVEFDKTMTLLHETREETEGWFVEWNPSFILPQLEKGDEVRISSTSAARGEIVDRNERGIAINGTGYEIGIVPERFTDDSKKAEVAELLGVSEEHIDNQLNQSWVQPEHFVPLTVASSSDQELLSQAVQIPGVTYQETEMREYPYGEALSHLVGYIGQITGEQFEELKEEGYTETDLIGRQGLERHLEDRLRGTDGSLIYIQKPEMDPITVAETPAEDGETIALTIDAELQNATYEAMRGEPGASAAVDPTTGETLALVSSPGFVPSEFMLGISGEKYTALTEDPLNPLYNRFAAAYAPGSTIKPVTAAIGMEAGTLDPSAGLTINGPTWQKDDSWGNYRVTRLHPEAPNPIDLNRALVYSDNIYFARQALEMGRETLVSGLESFGFGEAVPFVLDLRSSQVSNDGTLSSEGQLADTSFGQGQMLANILHLATVYQPILTDGIMYEPTLLLEEEDAQVWKENLLSAENAEVLRGNLRNVVVDGFAQAANLPDIPLAGKTGTAETKASAEDTGQDNGFFIAYNSENPDFIIAMMIEDVADNDGSGYVAELVADVYTDER
ncbi:penicillin-binding transpeptidase domain-containing protein [Planococcus salinus]|uniref:Penicillin-binding transpeptidase domain-containing protein n=1 Tax=Planococcus salinus TaxID=1848460 RepID=A0A3M8P671_9BACL|nr:penicillin-binding transpeptidase domain-containing protein [Planococcus salinus]RNF38901.1 penicillin-binding transpeptidase domain-containing protein [Planococcus salinus]